MVNGQHKNTLKRSLSQYTTKSVTHPLQSTCSLGRNTL